MEERKITPRSSTMTQCCFEVVSHFFTFGTPEHDYRVCPTCNTGWSMMRENPHAPPPPANTGASPLHTRTPNHLIDWEKEVRDFFISYNGHPSSVGSHEVRATLARQLARNYGLTSDDATRRRLDNFHTKVKLAFGFVKNHNGVLIWGGVPQ